MTNIIKKAKIEFIIDVINNGQNDPFIPFIKEFWFGATISGEIFYRRILESKNSYDDPDGKHWFPYIFGLYNERPQQFFGINNDDKLKLDDECKKEFIMYLAFK